MPGYGKNHHVNLDNANFLKRHRMANYRYGRYVYGPDPLALPYDVRGAVDEMGDAILAGASPADPRNPA